MTKKADESVVISHNSLISQEGDFVEVFTSVWFLGEYFIKITKTVIKEMMDDDKGEVDHRRREG